MSYGIVAACLDLFALVIGAPGFHFFESVVWLAATLNATMILTGNGPHVHPQTVGAEVFQLCYPLFGVFFW